MVRSVEEFADAYDDWADDYDDDYKADTADAELYEKAIACLVEHASPATSDTVLDLGTGTGAVALQLAEQAGRVIGRDVSKGMLQQARQKAAALGIDNVAFGRGRFREPNVESADVVVSNWAMHHLPPEKQYDAIATIASLNPRRFVLGTAMYFDDRHPEGSIFNSDSVYPPTVGRLVESMTDVGFVVADVEAIDQELGVLVAE